MTFNELFLYIPFTLISHKVQLIFVMLKKFSTKYLKIYLMYAAFLFFNVINRINSSKLYYQKNI